MNRLIDANKLMDELRNSICADSMCGAFYNIFDIVNEQPAVDAVEVVRCKDCKHRPVDGALGVFPPVIDDCEDWVCPYLCYGDDYYNGVPNDNLFCDKGEKKVNK